MWTIVWTIPWTEIAKIRVQNPFLNYSVHAIVHAIAGVNVPTWYSTTPYLANCSRNSSCLTNLRCEWTLRSMYSHRERTVRNQYSANISRKTCCLLFVLCSNNKWPIYCAIFAMVGFRFGHISVRPSLSSQMPGSVCWGRGAEWRGGSRSLILDYMTLTELIRFTFRTFIVVVFKAEKWLGNTVNLHSNDRVKEPIHNSNNELCSLKKLPILHKNKFLVIKSRSKTDMFPDNVVSKKKLAFYLLYDDGKFKT